MMTATEAMQARRSIREFEDELVPDVVVREIVAAAGRAPSSKNTQPWRLFLARGAALEAIRTDYLAAFDAGREAQVPYAYSAARLPDEWMARARETGYGIFQHKGIARDDKAARRAHDRENFHFFGAPQVFFLGTTDGAYGHGTFFDCGFVFNNLMLGLVSHGYGSCPQYSPMIYADILKRHLPGSADVLFIAAMPFGRPKAGSHVNEFQPTRLPVDAWLTVAE